MQSGTIAAEVSSLTARSPSQAESQVVDSEFAQSMGYMTTYLRALENARVDRLFDDCFAEPLIARQREHLARLLGEESALHAHGETLVAIRTRYLDEAISQRAPNTRQVVLLGAGLDARAYRLESLRDCHVLEVDQGAELLEHKSDVLQELHAPLVARKVDVVVANLANAAWHDKLVARGFDPCQPTFWAIEGLLPYLDQASNATLLETVDSLSAPSSELWADMAGRVVMESAEFGGRMMKYGEDDPLHGVLSGIPWHMELQASLDSAATHFGRAWTPLLSPLSKRPVSFNFVLGKKPTPSTVQERELCPGLDF